ncbi:MAG: hypothetical protein GY943_03325, partial [Chloroflexi bacterium]|nr:hypothetical protein [Chloroflexota bacterium]
NYFRRRQEGNGRFLIITLFFILLFALLVTTQLTTTQPAAFNSGPVASYIIQAEEIETAVVKVEQVGGHITHELGIINAVAADLTAAQYAKLVDQAGLSLHVNAQVQNASYNYLPAQSTTTITTYHSSDVPKSLSSSGTPTVSSVINVADSGTIATVKVMNLQGSHTYVGDLDFNLISPQGTEVQILDLVDTCYSQDDFDIHLDDSAASSNFPCPPTDGGTYRPNYALSTFAGEDSQGTWTLRVDDNYEGDGGSLDSWGLEIGLLDTETTPPPTATANEQWVELTDDNFESGWGNYTDGGSDASRNSENPPQGTYAINIQDNSGSSSSFYHTNGIDVATANYTQIKVDFSFYAVSMESNEDFWVQYYDGSTWQTVASYVRGSNFENNVLYNESIIIDEGAFTFPTNMKIRFMADASSNYDDVYIDEIVVSASNETSSAPTATAPAPTATTPPPTATSPAPTATAPPPTATSPAPTATAPPPTGTVCTTYNSADTPLALPNGTASISSNTTINASGT